MNCKKKLLLSSVIVIILVLTTLALLFINTIYSHKRSGTVFDESNNSYETIHDIPSFLSSIVSKENLINESSTKYSVLYGERNNREMYVFSAPILEQNEEGVQLMKNDILPNDDHYYIKNQHYCVSFEKNRICMSNEHDELSLSSSDFLSIEIIKNYQSIYGLRDEAVKYTNTLGNYMYCIPTYNGVLIEYYVNNQVDKFDFNIDLASYSFENDPAGYVKVLDSDGRKAAMIFQSMIFDDNGEFDGFGVAQILRKNGKCSLIYNAPKNVTYPYKHVISIDLYSEKMFFDTSTYSAKPNTNFILNNISYFPINHDNGKSRTYIKANLRSITPSSSELLDKATLSLYAIYVKGEIVLEAYKVRADWCSWTMNWSNHPPYYEKVGEITVGKSGWHDIDLTDYMRDLIDAEYDLKTDNSIVIVAKTGDAGEAIFASADNSCAPPYYRISYHYD